MREKTYREPIYWWIIGDTPEACTRIPYGETPEAYGAHRGPSCRSGVGPSSARGRTAKEAIRANNRAVARYANRREG